MIRAAQLQDIPEILNVVHDSIRSCIKDHHRHESTIQIWLENKTQSNLIMWMHYNDSWVYVLNQHVVGFIMSVIKVVFYSIIFHPLNNSAVLGKPY